MDVCHCTAYTLRSYVFVTLLYCTSKKCSVDSVSQPVFINEDIYRINKLTTTDKALYRFYVADKSVPPIYLRELS